MPANQLEKYKHLAQNASSPPAFAIDEENLDVVDCFTYLGSKVTSSLSIEEEINSRIGKAAAKMAKLSKRVLENGKLTERTKMCVYKACVISTLLYGSETWTTYTSQERKLNSFHLRFLRRILGIKWQDKESNSVVLMRAGAPSMFAILSERRLRWLGHVKRMSPGRIPKDLLYG